MLRVCQGATTKADMMEQSLTEYKEMYTIARAQFRRITEVRILATTINRSLIFARAYETTWEVHRHVPKEEGLGEVVATVTEEVEEAATVVEGDMGEAATVVTEMVIPLPLLLVEVAGVVEPEEELQSVEEERD